MSLSSLYKKSISGVVCISSGNGSFFSTSSGFLIDSIHIVTCCHCVFTMRGSKERVVKVFVDVPGANIVDADIVGADGTADIAVLRLRAPIRGAVPLKWASSRPERGDQCILLGTPQGDVQSVSNAYIRDTSFYGTSLLPTVMESILLDGSAIGGNSGGPLLNMSGEVIGILAYGYNSVSGGTMNGAIPSWIASPIVSWILSNRRNYMFGTLGIKVSPLYIDDALFLDMDKVQGYMVLSKSSPIASTLKLSEGDILMSILLDGKEYTLGQMNSQHCIFSLIHMNAGKSVTLRIKRNGKDMSLSFIIPSTTSTVPQNGNL